MHLLADLFHFSLLDGVCQVNFVNLTKPALIIGKSFFVG